MVITRFAPSPTGYLHIGNVRTALVNWLCSKLNDGIFILRIDDTDQQRSKDEYIEAIRRDLKWLGLSWDKEESQSSRFARYAQVISDFKTAGYLYPCYETPEELDFKRKLQLNQGRPPIYDRAALKLTDAEINKYENEGRKPHWRFKLIDKSISWHDKVRGEINFHGRNLSDPIVIRECNTPTYMLPSSIDDSDMHITDIVRGEDHITNTAIQMQMLEILGNKLPNFAHLSLINSKEGKISKRVGGFEIKDLRGNFIKPMAILSLLAKIGTSDAIELINDNQQLIQEFSFSKFSKSTAKYDYEDLERLNTKVIHNMAYEEAQADLKNLNADYVDADFWYKVRANLTNIDEILLWWKICKENINENIADDDREFLQSTTNLLPDDVTVNDAWEIWIKKIKSITNRKGKALFMPIRQALTGCTAGPELKNILPLIPRDKIIMRLQGADN
ncbi:MAG: glutamate--tRNA ligase, partial [Pseudomonadota bacterium]